MAFYILPHCKIWDQIIHLKNISQMLTSVQRQFLLRHICQTLPVYDQISLICTVNPTDNIQKRGLTPLVSSNNQKNCQFLQSFFLSFFWLIFIHQSIPQSADKIAEKKTRIHYMRETLMCPVCRQEDETTTPLLAHSPASPDMVAMVIYQKSFLHLPFYRQSKDRMEKGVHVPREIAARWYITVHWNISLRSMKL